MSDAELDALIEATYKVEQIAPGQRRKSPRNA
jgi:hypothetical protein